MMPGRIVRLTHGAGLLAGGTGLAYAAMRYLMRPADEFALVNHPWQPHMHHAHVLLSPLLAMVLGHLLLTHAPYHWSRGTREGRITGDLVGQQQGDSGLELLLDRVALHPAGACDVEPAAPLLIVSIGSNDL